MKLFSSTIKILLYLWITYPDQWCQKIKLLRGLTTLHSQTYSSCVSYWAHVGCESMAGFTSGHSEHQVGPCTGNRDIRRTSPWTEGTNPNQMLIWLGLNTCLYAQVPIHQCLKNKSPVITSFLNALLSSQLLHHWNKFSLLFVVVSLLCLLHTRS